MNWLIWKKIFTYFYNKFRPVNHMHYVKCGVNSSLHNSGCCKRSAAPWITVLSWHTVITKRVITTNLLLCHIPRNKALRTSPHHIWRTACPFFDRKKNKVVQNGWRFHWPVFVVTTSAGACCCCCCYSSSSSKQSSPSLASTPDSPTRCQWPEFHCWLQVLLTFSGHCSTPTVVCHV